MSRSALQKLVILAAVFCLAGVFLRFLLPLLLPFLLGAGLALAAEPAVSFAAKRLRLPRGAASALGVSGTLVLFITLLVLCVTVLIRELGVLTDALPDLEAAFQDGMDALEEVLLSAAAHTADGIRPLLIRSVLGLTRNGTAVWDKMVKRLPAVASALLSHVPGSLITLGTGLLSGYMISARLPKIRAWAGKWLPVQWKKQYLPALRRVRQAIAGWLKAQVKLTGVTFLIVLTGLIVLRVTYAPVWALCIALVDAIPVLGTGTVLLPWSLVCLLRGDTVLSIGLAAVYAAAAVTRSALEPRLVGKQLGLDPLVTLLSLYAGYRLWGLAGMLLSPLLAVAATQTVRQGQ